MSPTFKQCETAALQLPVTERAALAERLIASLDGVEDADVERQWLAEVEDRYRAFQRGDLTARSARDVLQSARARLS